MWYLICVTKQVCWIYVTGGIRLCKSFTVPEYQDEQCQQPDHHWPVLLWFIDSMPEPGEPISAARLLIELINSLSTQKHCFSYRTVWRFQRWIMESTGFSKGSFLCWFIKRTWSKMQGSDPWVETNTSFKLTIRKYHLNSLNKLGLTCAKCMA